MADYSEAYKKYFKDRLGMSIEELDKIFSSANIKKGAPMETPYGKSFLSYTPDGKIAGKTGAALRGLRGAATADMSLAEGLAKSVAPGIAGLVEAIPPITKYAGENPTASLTEAALSPEGSKGIARGVGAMAGMEAGTYLGGLSPIAKGPAIFAGAVAGMAAGAKLGDLLTGIPSIDKAIRALYEKELRKREDKMAEDMGGDTPTMQLLEPIQSTELRSARAKDSALKATAE